MSKPKKTETIDRLPPHSEESEKAVLGCIMLAPVDSIATCISKIGNDAEAFYDLRHQTLYGILVQMYDEQEAIDIVTVTTWLGFQDKLEQAGGAVYIATLADATPSAANLPYYLDTVIDRYRARKLLRIATETAGSIYNGGDDVNDLINAHSQEISELAEASAVDEDVPMHPLVIDALHQIEQWHQNQGVMTGIPSGFPDLDRMTTGFQNGEMIVIAARPSMGKTSHAMNIVEHVAVHLNIPVGVFSMEMTKKALVLRLIGSLARVNLRRIQDGFMPATDFPKLTTAAGQLNHAPIFINDKSSMTILELRARARRMKRMFGIRLLVIDYLQLMSSQRRGNTNRQEEVSEISRGVKGIAKELDIPVIVLSQLSRQIEQDKNRRPRLADLRESGAIEQDADLVAFLYKPEGDEDGHADGTPVNLYVAKQRNGPTGDVKLVFFRHWCRFEQVSHVHAEDIPQDVQPEMSYGS